MSASSDHPLLKDAVASTSELARTRTALAAERTLMAWVRTSLAMIGFGFTIYEFLHGMQDAGGVRLRRPDSPRDLGLFLAALGTGSLVAGLLEYFLTLRRLRGRRTHWGPAFYVACLVLVLGTFVLVGLIGHRGPL